MLHAAGVTRVRGEVDERTSLLDHEREERERGSSLAPAFAWLPWDEHLVQIIDTPGSPGLAHERDLALHGADSAVVVVSAPDGVEYGAESALRTAGRLGKPRVVVLNKMDRPGDVAGICRHLERLTGAKVVPLQVPFDNDEGEFAGVVSLLKRKALRYHPDGSGTYSIEPMPDRVSGACDAAWELVMEAVALTDDELLEHYLEYLELPVDLVREGLARGMAKGLVVPVLFASGHSNIGAHALLDLAVWALPAAAGDASAPFAARLLATRYDADNQPYHVMRVLQGLPSRGMAWTTSAGTGRVRKLYQVRGPRRAVAASMGPGCIVAAWDELPGRPGDLVYDGKKPDQLQEELFDPLPEPAHMAAWMLMPREARDERRLDEALCALVSTDRGLQLDVEPLSGLPVLRGTTDDHLHHAVRFLEGRLGVRVTTALEPVAFREVPAGECRAIQGVHRVAGGGDVSEYGECFIDLAPCSPEQGLSVSMAEYIDDCIPNRFHEGLERGLASGLREGPTAGYPVIGVAIHVTGGDYDVFMSDEGHFELAGHAAAVSALQATSSSLVEPWSTLEIAAPANEVGDILNDVAAHRGRILGMEVRGATASVRAQLPDLELRAFGPRLQAITGGRGQFEASHSHYGWLPAAYVREAIDASPLRNPVHRPGPATGGTPKPATREVRPFSRQAYAVTRGAKA